MGRVLDGAVLLQRVDCGRLLGACRFERRTDQTPQGLDRFCRAVRVNSARNQ
jgi:hypothetical protein